MRENRENIKTEDLLSDERLLEKLRERKQRVNEKMTRDELLAVDILDVLVERKKKITQEERTVLESRIRTSIKSQRATRMLTWGSVAAIFVLLIGITWFLKTSGKSDIRLYAETLEVSASTNTQLVLNQGQGYEIAAPNSEIAYSANGEEVKITSNGKSVVLSNLHEAATQPEFERTYSLVVVPYGRRSQVVLPDNSVVWLNSGSKLTYPAHFEKNKREVVLEGEAVFEVSHDAACPFFVLTKDIDVRVLGTVFCVSAYADEKVVSTVLQEGAVELNYRSKIPGFKTTEKMVPGMKVDLHTADRSLTKSVVDPSEYLSWKDGYLKLKNNTLEAIGKRLSRYYNIRILFENEQLKEETFSGYLDLKGSAKEILQIITEITGNEVVEDNGALLIQEKQNPV